MEYRWFFTLDNNSQKKDNLVHNTVLHNFFFSALTLMCISINANNIVYSCKIFHVNVNNKDSAAQCNIFQS